MTGSAFEEDVLGKLSDGYPCPRGIARALVRALELSGQQRLPAAVVAGLEASAYRLEALRDPADKLAIELAAWEAAKWHRVLSALALGAEADDEREAGADARQEKGARSATTPAAPCPPDGSAG